MTKIYTKAGDRGTTGTFMGRMAKSDQLATTIGTVDELNSWIGLCRNSPLTPLFIKERGTKGVSLDSELKKIQNNLLILGSQLAGSGKEIRQVETRNLERLIDKLTKELPRLSNFIFPTGDLQVARSVCRRAEREVVQLATERQSDKVTKRILKYLNRLSDALFTMGRWVNFKLGLEEEVWRG